MKTTRRTLVASLRALWYPGEEPTGTVMVPPSASESKRKWQLITMVEQTLIKSPQLTWNVLLVAFRCWWRVRIEFNFSYSLILKPLRLVLHIEIGEKKRNWRVWGLIITSMTFDIFISLVTTAQVTFYHWKKCIFLLRKCMEISYVSICNAFKIHVLIVRLHIYSKQYIL